MSIHLLSASLGVAVFLAIIFMVRRDHLVSKDAAGWIIIAFFIVILGFFPGITDWIGGIFNVAYPPILLLLTAVLLLLVKMVKADIDKAHLKADVERLLQHQALLHAELRKLQDEFSKR